MSYIKRVREYFQSGSRGVGGRRFKSENKPDEAIFMDLFESILFKLNDDDRATETSNGHCVIAIDDDCIARVTPEFKTAVVLARHLPNIYFSPLPEHTNITLIGKKKGLEIYSAVYNKDGKKRKDFIFNFNFNIVSGDNSISVSSTEGVFDIRVVKNIDVFQEIVTYNKTKTKSSFIVDSNDVTGLNLNNSNTPIKLSQDNGLRADIVFTSPSVIKINVGSNDEVYAELLFDNNSLEIINNRLSVKKHVNNIYLNGDLQVYDAGSKSWLLSQKQADWAETNTSSPGYIKNKPIIPVYYANSFTSFNAGVNYLNSIGGGILYISGIINIASGNNIWWDLSKIVVKGVNREARLEMSSSSARINIIDGCMFEDITFYGYSTNFSTSDPNVEFLNVKHGSDNVCVLTFKNCNFMYLVGKCRVGSSKTYKNINIDLSNYSGTSYEVFVEVLEANIYSMPKYGESGDNCEGLTIYINNKDSNNNNVLKKFVLRAYRAYQKYRNYNMVNIFAAEDKINNSVSDSLRYHIDNTVAVDSSLTKDNNLPGDTYTNY